MQAAETTEQIRAITQPVRAARSSIGFVPTMGALHEGHLELIHTAKRECDFVVVSIFVNPIQFGPGEDYASYPRPTADDLVKCSSAGVDVVFNPSVDQMYRPDRVTTVHVAGLTETLCGLNRPAHFDGVTTVVAKLFNIVQPDTAYFGQKDAQQAIVVHRMIVDLDFPVKLRICPTVRTPAGLALSSRNEYLTDGQLGQASCLYRALTAARDMIRLGETHTERLTDQMRRTIDTAGPAEVDYMSVVDPRSAEYVERIDKPVLIALAVRIGRARLIDNMVVDANGAEVGLEAVLGR